MYWNDKPYHSLDYECKKQFGYKLYKLALDGGMSCPGRNKQDGSGGCIFCSQGGSGEFAQPFQTPDSIAQQIELAKNRINHKLPSGSQSRCRFIAYFQSYTNTYASVEYLQSIFLPVIHHPDIAVLSIATRPDCLPPDVMELLSYLNTIKPVWIELGLQTIHETTAVFIQRGYHLSCFEQAFQKLKQSDITVIAHVILGLPGETSSMIMETIHYLGNLNWSLSPNYPGIDGIKLQLLHILKGTQLAESYQQSPFHLFSMEEYLELVIDCVSALPPNTIIHRLTGDGPKSLLMAPLWSSNKKLVINSLAKRFREREEYQGKSYSSPGRTIPSSVTFTP